MRVESVGSNVVCLTAMQPTALDLAALETAGQLGRPATQVVNPQLALADYTRLRVIVTPDGRAQADFNSNVSRDMCRRTATELVRQASIVGVRGVGFNGVAKLECEPDEQPLHRFFNPEAVQHLLGTEPERSGAKFMFSADDRARLTLDITPHEDEPTVWIASLNRHYAGPADDDVYQRGISWLAALDSELRTMLRRLPEGASVGS